ncbi:hypothetical protein EV361DRAFT_845470 [Lentinula raphanica]|uniref:Nuclear segregation protein Bfr1 n=1 Tax=Lentinula raphanica TaxID=153919 RepID=A0AA38P3V3_9AGAR|nr:hypothetical protein F5878DRAFT_566946 [Lentinula raphanica]KAJ3972228.1 hypothetical protein EV361DRAFT_845470 [Lentinula raphanica]
MAPAPKSKPANGSATKGKASAVPTNGTTTPVSVASEKKDTSEAPAASGGKPDKKAYDAEQERLKGEIDALQLKVTAVKDKISLVTKGGPGNERRNALRAELDQIRGQQSNNKTSRGKVFEQIKAYDETIKRKIKDLQASKGKIAFKSTAELDAHIKNLEKQVDSGTLKLADEKRALAEITSCKRNRRTLESFQAEQDSIDADRAAVADLRKQLDDPDFKSMSDRYDKVKQELDELKKEDDVHYANRSKLFEERESLQLQLTALYDEKRLSAQTYREANDRYFTKINEDRARRAERARAQRAAEELQQKQETAQRLREEAEAPAYQAQIEDCQTLIESFSGKSSETGTLKSVPLVGKQELAGVSKLELRKVEDVPEGAVVRKKKGEDEESYFVGGKGKSKGKKGKANAPAETSSPLNLPFSTLTALSNFSIPPPTSNADIPRVIENLKTKKAWFEANQARQTAANIAKAEAEIQRLTGSSKNVQSPDVADVTPPNGGGEIPSDPAPTPSVSGPSSLAVPSDEVLDKLEVVNETPVASDS